MSEATSSETIGKTAWANKLLKNWALTRLGHEGMMLDKIQRQNGIVEANVRRMAGLNPVDDDMGVSIGNEIHYHQDKSNPQGMSPLAKAAVAAALLAAGAGAGALPWLLASKPGDVPAAVDTINEYSVGFGQPETIETESE